MGRAAGLIRLLLAGVFLLARAALGVTASAGPLPATTVSQTEVHHVAGHAAPTTAGVSGKAATDAPCRQHRAMPCNCGPGLCGTAVAVLPATAFRGPLLATTVAFTPGPASAVVGICASPALPPPRI